jgi:hypothetical protein
MLDKFTPNAIADSCQPETLANAIINFRLTLGYLSYDQQA